MTDQNVTIKDITLAYFSGTGCTEMIVDCFENQLMKLGINVNRVKIACSNTNKPAKSDLLIIFSPVYAFRLTSIVEKWTKNLPKTENTYAAIVSVSGGGEVTPNTACRVYCKHLLQRKGYHLIYEKMLVMPSNIATQAEQQLNFRLIKIIPQKTNQMITDILSGKKCITHPKLQDRVFSSIGRAEHLGARLFGASFCASKNCNQCGLCIQNCPKKNIQMLNGRPKFGFGCMWCLRCIYSCPRKALSPKMLKFVVLKNGFDLKAMSRMADEYKHETGYTPSQSIQWKGITDYLNE